MSEAITVTKRDDQLGVGAPSSCVRLHALMRHTPAASTQRQAVTPPSATRVVC
jgi:hypothetical protein